eukprot:358840-Amphidinium_carterae.1
MFVMWLGTFVGVGVEVFVSISRGSEAEGRVRTRVKTQHTRLADLVWDRQAAHRNASMDSSPQKTVPTSFTSFAHFGHHLRAERTLFRFRGEGNSLRAE